MVLRRCAVISTVITAMLVVFACMSVNADAATAKNAYYIVESNYDETTLDYTVDVYLYTDVYLATGTFGIKFNPADLPNIVYNTNPNLGNDGYMQVDTTNFMYLKTPLFDSYATYFQTNGYIVVQWGRDDKDASNPVIGKLKLGSFTVPNVPKTVASSNPFSLLDWSSTATTTPPGPAADPVFTAFDSVSKSLNEEIWRDCNQTELAADPDIPGYYQGCAYDDANDAGTWIDIGMKFVSNMNDKLKIKGTVYAYNPKHDISVYAYDVVTGTLEGTGTIKEWYIYPDGAIKYVYEVQVADPGAYNLEIQKFVHLTYGKQITVPTGLTGEFDAGEIELICGDINEDGYVKYPDRAAFVRFLNRQKQWSVFTAEFDAADLNGDNYVNLFDLSILKRNIDRTYI